MTKTTNYTNKTVISFMIITIGGIVTSILGYLLRIFLARNLTPTEYGLIYAIFSFAGLFAIFQSLGLNQAIVHSIQKYRIKNQQSEIKQVILYVLKTQLIASTILGLGLIISSSYLAQHLFKNESATVLIIIYASALILSPIESWFLSIFQGFSKMKEYALITLLRSIFLLISTIIFVKVLRWGVIGVMWPYVIVYLLSLLIYLPLLLQIIPFHKIKTNNSKNLIIKKELWQYGLAVIVSGIAGQIITYTDSFMLTLFRSVEEVGLYNIALPTAITLWFFSTMLLTVLFPTAAELWNKNKKQELKQGIEMLYKYCIIALLPVTTIVIAFPQIIINLLFGAQYIKASVALQILAIGALVYNIAMINSAILSGIGKPKIYTVATIIAAITNIILNIILIPFWGIEGAALSTLISFIIIMIMTTYSVEKIITVTIPFKEWIYAGLSAIIVGIITYVIKENLILNSWIEALICCSIAIIIYSALILITKTITIEEIKARIQQSGILHNLKTKIPKRKNA